MSPYDKADKELKRVFERIKNEFNRHRLKIQTFDELNVLGIRQQTDKLYKKLKEINRAYYLEIAEEAYEDACAEMSVPPKNGIDEKWIAVLLAEVNAVTNYIYDSELERKRDRFYESILSAKYRKSEDELQKAYNTAIKLWNRQTEQYEINVVASARLQAFEDEEVEQVIWHTQEDGHVCNVCEELDWQIFPISNIPSTHYYCRCFFSPILNSRA